MSRDVLDPAAFAALMGRLSITPSTTMVLRPDSSLWAAFAFWVLRYRGHAHVRLLDGGHRAGARAGRPLVTETPDLGTTVYPLRPCHA